MDRFRVFSRLAAVGVLLAASPASLVAEEARGGPADPTAMTLPMPNDAGPFAAYLDPRLRGEGPDAIERSDFEQANKVSPATASPNPSTSQEGSLPSSAHEGHVGHGPGGSSKNREAE